MLKDIEAKFIDDDYLIENYGRTQGLSPEEILIKKEERQTIINLIGELLEKLKYDDRKLLIMYVIEGRTQFDIAKELGVTQQAINKKIDVFYKKAKKRLLYRTYILCKQLLLDNPSMEEADTPKIHTGWLCTRLTKVGTTEKRPKNINEDPNYKYNKHQKKKVYVTPIECRINTYTPAICSMCGIKCTNEIMKERKKKFISKKVSDL